jgi:CRISPR-associated protein Cas2
VKSDRIRNKVAKSCLKVGLNRVQYSVFLGTITPNEKETLVEIFLDLIDEETDSVYVFPMSKDELKETDLLGQAFDKKRVTDEISAMFI